MSLYCKHILHRPFPYFPILVQKLRSLRG